MSGIFYNLMKNVQEINGSSRSVVTLRHPETQLGISDIDCVFTKKRYKPNGIFQCKYPLINLSIGYRAIFLPVNWRDRSKSRYTFQKMCEEIFAYVREMHGKSCEFY